jgi:hypothetical protein
MNAVRGFSAAYAAAFLSIALTGCSGGGLRNVVSWMRPANYRTLDKLQSPADGAGDQALVAERSTEAQSDDKSITSRLADRLPWNKTVEPDPFLVADAGGVSPDDERLDVSAIDEFQTVSSSRDIGPLPTIQPESQQPEAFRPEATVAGVPEVSPETPKVRAETPQRRVPDAEADMAAIERMIARLDPPRQPTTEAEPLFGADAAPTDFDQIMRNASDVVQEEAEGMVAETSERLIRDELPKVDDQLDAFNRHLAAAVASHDRHAVTGAAADRALERAIAPNQFDQLLDLDRLSKDESAALPLSSTGSPTIRPTAKHGVTVAQVEQAFPGATQPAAEQVSPAETEGGHLIDAVDAFDRNLARDEATQHAAEMAAFDWQVPAALPTGAAPEPQFDEAAVPPAAANDPFVTVSAAAEYKPSGSPIAFSEFYEKQHAAAELVTSSVQHTESPFQFAGGSRAVDTAAVPPPIIRIPSTNEDPWSTAESLESDPYFQQQDGAGADAAPVPPLEEVAARTDAPNLVVAENGGLTTRNVLLLLGGMIVVILLFAPGRKHS